MDAILSMLTTSRRFTTRISEHQRKDSPVVKHLVEFFGTAHHNEWNILNAYRGLENLMTTEAIYMKTLKPQLNTREEKRGGNCIDINHLVQLQKSSIDF